MPDQHLEELLEQVASKIQESTRANETNFWRTVSKFLLGVIVAGVIAYGSILYTVSKKIQHEAPYNKDKPLIESTLINLNKSTEQLKEAVNDIRLNQVRLHPEKFEGE